MPQPKPTVGIYTMGCKVNQYESEAIAEAFSARGFAVCPPETPCDFYVINTCTVTGESDRKAGQLCRRAHKENPAAFILVTGCLSQSRPEAFSALSFVDYLCGNDRKLSVVDAAERFLREGRGSAPLLQVAPLSDAPFEEMEITHFDRTRAYVKIEDGCENRCAYCAIPGARGPVRSKPLPAVLREVQKLTENGCREVVLTGIETASYGKDIGCDLLALLTAVDQIPGIGRIRLGSLDPSLMREDFVAALAKLRHLAPHFHLSVQSGSSAVLAAMKRKYNADMAHAAVERLRRRFPDVELTADFIVGFPGETKADFEESARMVREAGFLQIHVFPYSRRAGTPAAVMKNQLPMPVKKERCAALIALGKEVRAARLSRALLSGGTQAVLFETFENGLAIGHTASFLEVEVPSDENIHGKEYAVRLTGIRSDRLCGEIVRACSDDRSFSK